MTAPDSTFLFQVDYPGVVTYKSVLLIRNQPREDNANSFIDYNNKMH